MSTVETLSPPVVAEPTTKAGREMLDTLAPVTTEMAAADRNRRAALGRRARFAKDIHAIEAEAAAAERAAIRAAWLDRAGDGGFFTALLKDILDDRAPNP